MQENMPNRKRMRRAIPIRVRGMSNENRFFDEQTETYFVGRQMVVTYLRNLTELDTELHVTNLESNAGGTFQVVWVNTRATNGLFAVGLEFLEPEGDLWGTNIEARTPVERETAPRVWLVCQRCHQKSLAEVPEAQSEFLREGFRVARHCNRCKATTAWEFVAESAPADVEPALARTIPAPSAASPRPATALRENQRLKARVPLQMPIKVIRQTYGTTLEDITKTLNVSRSGAYFLTNETYAVGEPVKVILPYKQDDVAIPVPARVVRWDQPKQSYQNGVAIHLLV